MDTTLESKANMLKILGHPVRLRIIAGLAQNNSCVKDIWECLNMPQAVVSQHLKVMKDCGVLDAHREGTRIRYSVCDEMVLDLLRALRLDDPNGDSMSLRLVSGEGRGQ